MTCKNCGKRIKLFHDSYWIHSYSGFRYCNDKIHCTNIAEPMPEASVVQKILDQYND